MSVTDENLPTIAVMVDVPGAFQSDLVLDIDRFRLGLRFLRRWLFDLPRLIAVSTADWIHHSIEAHCLLVAHR